MRRIRVDGKGKHPWKAEVTEGDAGVSSTTIDGWYTQVYEPVYLPPQQTVTITLDPQGGTVTPTSIDIPLGDTLGALPTPVFTGNTFNGWFTMAADGTEVTADTIADGTFYTIFAQWTPQ